MKKSIFALLWILSCLPLSLQAAQPTTHLDGVSIKQAVAKIKKNWLGNRSENAHIGVVIQSMRTGKVLFAENPNHLFTPASVLKLFTATAGLYYLKPNFVFTTDLYMNGRVTNHTLNGNLTLKFSGDPQLTSKDLMTLIGSLRKIGIERINGQVSIDATTYNSIPYPPGCLWDDLSYSYAAPLMTTIINHNYFSLILKNPGANALHPIIQTNLPNGVVHFINNIRMVKNPNQICPLVIYSNDKNEYRLQGCYYQRWKQQARKMAIRNMAMYEKVLLKELLNKNGIRYNGIIRFRPKEKNMQLIASYESQPLSKIVKKMLKESDNLATNAVFKKIGEHYSRSSGTWQNSLSAVKKILSSTTGINFKLNSLNDGAGLSRYNLITPLELAKLLNFSYHNKTIRDPFIAALPIAGIDGTMKYRLYDQRKGKGIHMKTGSMTGVSALAGYIHTKNAGDLAVVIIVNGFVKPKRPFIGMEDDICRYLAAHYHG